MKKTTYVLTEFNYATFKLDPYAGTDGGNSKLLKDIFSHVQNPSLPESLRVINRFGNRNIGSKKRTLIVLPAFFGPKGTRSFGKIALVKDKAPKFWGGKDVIHEIENKDNREFVELTHYIIDYTSPLNPVIMIEFNNSGPRLSDLEFCLRRISKEYTIAKSLSSSTILNIEYNDLMNSMQNVFKVNVKVNAQKLPYTHELNWLQELLGLKKQSGFHDLRLGFYYKPIKDSTTKKYKKNYFGMDYFRNMILWMKKDSSNLRNFSDFKVNYENEDGEIKEFDFLKNKTTSILKIPLSLDGGWNYKEYKEKAGQEFNMYITEGKTTQEED